MTQPTTPPQPPRQPRWQKRLLVGSLAFNLLIVGVVVGSLAAGGPGGGKPRLDLTVGPLTRAMAPADRDALRTRLRDAGAFSRTDRGAIRADMETLVNVLNAEQFDPAAFRAAITRQRDRLRQGQDAVLDAVTEQVEDMSQAERAAFADRLREQLRRGPPSRRSGEGPSGD